MVGNILGTEIINLIKNGSDVYIAIAVANAHGLWPSATWAYALSFTFIGITAITLFYFAFLFIKRMYINRQLRMQQVKYSVRVQFTVRSQIYSKILYIQYKILRYIPDICSVIHFCAEGDEKSDWKSNSKVTSADSADRWPGIVPLLNPKINKCVL